MLKIKYFREPDDTVIWSIIWSTFFSIFVYSFIYYSLIIIMSIFCTIVANILFFFMFFINICIIKFSISKWNYWSANILFLKTSSFLVNSICRFCCNLNSLNSLVMSNNTFNRRFCKAKLSC